MDARKLKDYAQVITKVGVNVQKGQVVIINSIVEAYPLTRLVVEECYKLGAKKVIIHWNDGEITRNDYLHQDLTTLTNIAKYDIDRLLIPAIKHGGCKISIGGNSPQMLKGIDSKKISEVIKKNGALLEPLHNFYMNNKSQWTIAYYPSVAWAKLVFPSLNEQKAVEKLFDEICKTVLIDGKTNPVLSWEKHNKQTSTWAKKLNNFNFEYLQFTNKIGTDVKIKLIKNHIWESGAFKGDGNVPSFTANLPTEEVWTMPDMYGVDGHVVATKPLSYCGNLIDGFWFDFKDGEVIKYGAKKGKEILDEIFTISGTKRTGEIALVPKTSPINLSKILFYSTLYDENASCHIALGSSYPNNVKNGSKLSIKELTKLHSNTSIEHIDFMFGSDDMNISGHDGKKFVEIMKNGLLII